MVKIRIFVIVILSHSLIAANIDSLKIELKNAIGDSAKVVLLEALIDGINEHKVWNEYNNQLLLIAQSSTNHPQHSRFFQVALARAYNNKGLYMSIIGANEMALNYLNKSRSLHEQLNNEKDLAEVFGNYAFINKELNLFQEALRYSLKSLELHEKHNNRSGIILTLKNIGKIYELTEDFDKATEFYSRSLSMLDIAEDAVSVFQVKGNLGYIEMKKKNYAEALILLNQAIDELVKLKAVEEYQYLYIYRGQLYEKLNEYSLAQQSYRLAYELIPLTDNLDFRASAAWHMQRISKHFKKFEECVKYYEEFTDYYDSLYNSSTRNSIIKNNLYLEYLEKELEFEKAQQQRNMQIVRQKDTIRIKQQQQLFLIITIVLILFGVVILYNRFQIIRKQNLIIDSQKNLVEFRNHEIMKSINYAKRIQTAILPPPRVVKEFLKESFILYLPKDIVAGDFYWMDSPSLEERGLGGEVFIAACDCTGHGVPGALVSVVCNNALNRAVNEFGERLPGKVFDKARELVLENFEKSDEEVKDGMDASLCALDIKNKKLLWAGANNPLWIIRTNSPSLEERGLGGEVIEYKPDKQPIGKGYDNKPFTTHEISLQEGDIIYLFTDGYADQFGGEKGKKMTKARFREFVLSIARQSMEQQREALLKFHDEYRGQEEQVDDICVIGVRV